MSWIHKIKQKLQELFVCPNNFGVDLQVILQYLFAVGIYHPETSKARMAYGIFMVTLLFSYNTECIKGFITGVKTNESKLIFYHGLYLVSAALILTQSFNFATNVKGFKGIYEHIKRMKDFDSEQIMVKYEELSKRITSFFVIYVRFVLFVLTLGNLLLGKHNHLITPTPFDKFTDGYLFYFTFFINFMQLGTIAHIYVSVEMLPIVCMLKIEACFEHLTEKIAACTNDINMQINENNLKKCIKYHVELLR